MKHLALLLLGTALVSTPALAQQTSQNMNAQPNATGTPSTTTTAAPSGSNTGMTNANYLTQNDPNLWRASELSGVEIYNDRNEEIGEIDEVLIGRDGSVKAVVIGVGGFLGIGERNVAVPFQRLQWQVRANDTAAARTGGNARMTGTATTGTGTAVPATGTTPATGAGAPAAGPGTARPNDTASNRNATEDRDAPRRAILANATKEELQNAPEFKYAD
jgi:sporulation protein YlmC with PRC-barrel domain